MSNQKNTNSPQEAKKVDRAEWMAAQGCQFRHFLSFEIRAGEVGAEGADAGALYVEGIATPFNTPTVLFSIDGVDYKEQIDARAFCLCVIKK